MPANIRLGGGVVTESDICSSLLRTLVSYEENEVLQIRPPTITPFAAVICSVL
jgi:hypothetical protein